MPTVVSDLGQTMIDDLHPWQQDDPTIQNILSAIGAEVQRVQDKMLDLWMKLLPQNADDSYNSLTLWEMLVGVIPANNPVLTESQRSALVMGYIAAHGAGSRTAWENILTLALGESDWSFTQGPGDYQITLTLPTRSTQPLATAIIALADVVTPAHLQVFAGFTGGFLVGISQLGVEPL
jgi:hypothetical protein